MKIIAVEEHWSHPLNKGIREEFEKRSDSVPTVFPGTYKEYFIRMTTEAVEDYRLKEMDEAGIAMQILSHAYPGIQGILHPAEAVEKAKIINDDLAEIIRKHPTRFKGFAALPMQDPKAAADELERCVKDYGYLGALINGQTNGEFLDEDKFRIVWERSAELGVPIYLHPSDPVSGQVKAYEGFPMMLGPAWSWNVETATNAMRIIYSGLFEEIPGATLIIGHMGEMLPYLLGRIDEGYWQKGGPESWKIKREPSYYIKKNMMISTSGMWNIETLVCAVSAMGADRILFSVDYPYVDSNWTVSQVQKSPISEEDKEKIFFGNAKKLFGL